MASHDYKDGGPGPVSGALGDASADISVEKLDLPSADSILPAPEGGPSTENREEIIPEEEARMFRTLQEVLDHASDDAESFDLQKLRDSLETADSGQRSPQLLRDVPSILDKLWRSRSKYMPRAAEALANGSRERETYPIMKFYHSARGFLLTRRSVMESSFRTIRSTGVLPATDYNKGRRSGGTSLVSFPETNWKHLR